MKNKRKSNNKGFTLVELVVVLAIIGVLLAMVVPGMMKYVEKAKEQQFVMDCRAAVMAYQTFSMEKLAAGEDDRTITREEVVELAGIKGVLVEVERVNREVLHLIYKRDGIEVTYCRDYKTCAGHKKLYTVN